MPPDGYQSVNVPSALYNRVKALIRARDELGYRSISEFVVESIRRRTEEIEKLSLQKSITQKISLEKDITNATK